MKIDFYILEENSPRDINQMVCQLCEKALAQNLTIVIYTKSIEQALQLDDLLWTYKADSFIAHKNDLNETETNTSFTYPVVISSFIKSDEQQLTSHAEQLLINLSNETPNFFQQFKRIAEIVGKIKNDKDAARNRYRFYREKGYTLNKYDL